MCESFKCPCGLTEEWVLTFPHPLPGGLEEAALSPISNLPWLKQFKLEHQILTLPRKCLQELDAGAKATQYFWIFKILRNHALIPRRAHAIGHLIELGTHVGALRPLWTRGVVGTIGVEGAGRPLWSQKQVVPRPPLDSVGTRPSVFWKTQCQPLCL